MSRARPGQARPGIPIQSNPIRAFFPALLVYTKRKRPAALFRADPSLTAIATALTDHDQQLKLIRSKAG
eukprot:jgi/Psemu1/58863/gm1.58863_g